jgi:putative oxidoreductase
MSVIPSIELKSDRMILPFMRGFYEHVAEPLAWAGCRVIFGLALVYEGWPKITAPFAQIGFLESLNFHPGWFWSPFLAALQFFGGMMIAAGLLTRPIALANTVMLAVTLWFHWAHPYGDAYLTAEGVALLKSQGATYFTPAALARLGDSGTFFLHQVQDKAMLASLFWTVGVGFYAAFGGGAWSLDRLLKKEF